MPRRALAFAALLIALTALAPAAVAGPEVVDADLLRDRIDRFVGALASGFDRLAATFGLSGEAAATEAPVGAAVDHFSAPDPEEMAGEIDPNG